MKDFKGITFHGTFRNYQQKVLDGANKHIQDGKINIVAAPGSGKTILGLELIRRLNSPCLIFSPTVTIRDQWGTRFADFFLDKEQKFEDYFSFNLNKLSLVTSVTYQALYSAMGKVKCEDDEEVVDYSNIDMFKLVIEAGIKTVCLDEAHHLQNEWQKALEKFIKGLNSEIKIVALTATPPYDANTTEWQRYSSICGEIDEEIFVPELVKTNTLCPHQDYVYFNYPTDAEIKDFEDYKARAEKAINELIKMPMFVELGRIINTEFKTNYDEIYTHAKEYIALLVLFKKAGIQINKKLVHLLTGKNDVPNYTQKFGETATNFLITTPLLDESAKEQIVALFKKHSLIEKRKICLDLNEKLKKRLISSLGKLNSIEEIVACENKSLGKNLRMLILTDYIKKDSIANVGTKNEFSDISVVSIFETIRRKNLNINIGVLSGTLVILPSYLKNYLKVNQDLALKGFTCKQIPGTIYSVFNFKGSNKEKVQIVGNLFAKGEINILVGTKSLLGEGWDSPCINSLILASFVGSFMLSNQMRGRAIRIDKNNPNKVSNIWHLVTIEPPHQFEEKKLTKKVKKYYEDHQILESCDYDTLERRFNCFVGPNYTTGEIESGIDRITNIKPPYSELGVKNINSKTRLLAQNRDKVKTMWKDGTENFSNVRVQSDIPKEAKVPAFVFQNVLTMIILTLVSSGIAYACADIFLATFSVGAIIIAGIVVLVFVLFGKKIMQKIMAHISPSRSIKTICNCVLKTLKKIGQIENNGKIKLSEGTNFDVKIMLTGVTTREENIFNTAITELFSPIENPRYIIIQKKNNDFNYTYSLACPTVIGQKKEYAEILSKEMSLTCGTMVLVYTRNENGRKFILECRKKSYITKNQRHINKKHKVSRWE